MAIGTAECDAWQDLAAIADRSAIVAAGLSVTQIGSAVALRCPAGGPLFNRAYGASGNLAELRAIRAHYEEADVPLYFVEIDDLPVRAESAAAATGLERYRRAYVHLSRSTWLAQPASSRLDVGPATAAEMEAAAAIFCAAFDADQRLVPVLASLHGAPRWHCLVVRDAGVVVAVGWLYVDHDLGYFVGGATTPAFRCQGAQLALIRARVLLAQRLGCQLVATRTGEPVADGEQVSERNLQRAGFHAIGRSQSYAPPGALWPHGRRGASR